MHQRQSNIELLRILAMMAIIAGHLIHQTCLFQETTGAKMFGVYLIGSCHRIAVNLFLFIGTWFLVESKFKAEKILRLYGQLAFYTIGISVLILAFGLPYTKYCLLQCFVPFLLSPLWFATVYISLLLLIPFLNYIPKAKSGQYMVTLLFLLVSVFSTINQMWDNLLCAFAWFAFVYLAMREFKSVILAYKVNKWIVLLLGISMYLLLVWLEFKGVNRAIQYIDDYKSIPNLIISLCIFYFFICTDMGSKKSINWLAASAFAVYIVHQTPNFYEILWNDIYKVSLWIKSDWLIVNVIVYTIFTYIWITLVDQVRKKLVEPLWIKSRLFNYLNKRLSTYYEIVEN